MVRGTEEGGRNNPGHAKPAESGPIYCGARGPSHCQEAPGFGGLALTPAEVSRQDLPRDACGGCPWENEQDTRWGYNSALRPQGKTAAAGPP